jgi:hypothetical protein
MKVSEGPLLKLSNYLIIHAIAKQPKGVAIQILAEEPHGTIDESEIGAARLPTDRESRGFWSAPGIGALNIDSG